MSESHLPVFPFGAVYFRKSNPPKDEWERDYRVAAEDGFNVFRHWFMWSATEVSPGEYDWDDYDRQFELAAKYGIKTIVGEISHAAPEWAFDEYRHCLYEDAHGEKVLSMMRNSSVTGGFPGLCLDHDDAKKLVGDFLTELVGRYKDHPAMGGYDVWNECNLRSSGFSHCYCPATLERFRAWLKRKYGDVKTLGEAWYRHSYTKWEQVQPPRRLEMYPDSMDWVQFQIDNAYEHFQWKVNLVRELDADHVITAHGVDDASLTRLVTAADSAWRAGSLVDVYGFTGGSSEARFMGIWKHWCSVDVTRAGADGKPFWSAEMASGPNWYWNYEGFPRDIGRMPKADDIRLHSLTSMAGGVTGIFSNRWRPLLDGPKFGSLAFYNMDGSRTDRSQMAGELSRWANAPQQEKLWQSAPVKGDVGILVIPETQMQSTLLTGNGDTYGNALRGVYQGFFDNNIQADWVSLAQIDNYDLLYLPRPLMLTKQTVTALTEWVARGGHLISEGCPAYFGDRGRAGVVQPNLGLAEVFGAVEDEVEFAPDLLAQEEMTFGVGEHKGVASGLYLQTYRPTQGQASGWYNDGRVAVVDHRYGQGKTRLMGTCPGLGYWQGADTATKRFFAGILEWAGKEPWVRCSSSQTTTRLHMGNGGTYLWIVNNDRAEAKGHFDLAEHAVSFSACEVLWGGSSPSLKGRRITATIAGFDGLVMRLV